MGISESAIKLRKAIENAIKCHKITHNEYESIMAIALEDGFLDIHEKALLNQLQEMIENKSIEITHSKSCNDNCDCK